MDELMFLGAEGGGACELEYDNDIDVYRPGARYLLLIIFLTRQVGGHNLSQDTNRHGQ